MSNIAYLAGVLKGDGYLYRGQTGRPRFQVETMSNYDSRVPFLELQDGAGFNRFLATFGGKA